MQTSFISTLTLWNSTRAGLGKLQNELAKANQESVDGRYADVGLALGNGVGLGIALRREMAEIDGLKAGNGLVSLRLSTTQASLSDMQKAADSVLATLVGTAPKQRAAAIKETAATQLAALTAGLNKASGGQYLFAGTNAQQKPMADYADAAKAKVADAFDLAFGFPQGDPRAAAISEADMTAFLDGAFAGLFDDADWKADWSSASSDALTTRISTTETVTTSTTANSAPVRMLAMAYVMASDLGAAAFSDKVQTLVTDRIIGLLGKASDGLVDVQADLGRSQATVTAANTRMGAQRALLATQLNDLEGVDQQAAISRGQLIQQQIQVSYNLTAQLRQLSLVNYL
ncbi:flagellar hook-associated family protein [uncultured Methylobacterium sp.]|jgi:flagellar hook-associated protein 3 FlgL|uniref:flagellar hook-associated family protein n=1 Tax=uncultured Methylobacterium sp. TaxID=157278 RepID=UPI0026255C20|nr:flagellar hook-associated family protein [uncultured Methylobacterium sp.]